MIHVYFKDERPQADHRGGDRVVQRDGEHLVLDVEGTVLARYPSDDVATTGGARKADQGRTRQ